MLQPVRIWPWQGTIGRESLLLVVGYITSFWLVLVHFEWLTILLQPNDLNIRFSEL